MMNNPNLEYQRGVVLIMSLLIVALVTVVVVELTWRFELGMARNENRWHGAQARAYLEAAEMLSCLGLKADFALDPETDEKKRIDHLGEQWALPGTPFPTDEGWVRGTIEDAHSRINLNLLGTFNTKNTKPKFDPANDPPHKQYTAMQKRFVRLLQLIELESGDFIDESNAIEILNNIKDWIDTDHKVSGYDGAEASYYEGLETPYPIANREMVTLSELSMIKGMTSELYTKLLPYVSVLPGPNADTQASGTVPEPAFMNINTMKPLLMRTLNRADRMMPLSEEDTLILLMLRGGPVPGSEGQNIETIPTIGFLTVKKFAEKADVESILGKLNKDDGFDISGLEVRSNYFYLDTETLVGEQIRRGKSLLYRDFKVGGNTTVIRRTSANY